MLFDGRNLPNGEILETDVCIIGGGASGITLALEFVDAPFNVLLMESGGLKLRHKTQWLYKAENVGRPYFDMEFTKQRYLGGASNKWFGRSRPLDEVDFEQRPWIEYSGWPFGRKELDPFYARAAMVCQLNANDYNPHSWESEDRKQLPLENTDVETKIFQFSPPTRFGKEYIGKIEKAQNIKTFLFSNAVSISLDPDGGKAKYVNFSTLWGNRFQVKARQTILAASALENTRLLLVSNDVCSNGIGNQNDLVGRFFMEHPHIFECALLTPLTPNQTRYYKILDYDAVSANLGTVGALGLTEEALRREKLLNASVFFVRRKSFKIDDRYFSQAGYALSRLMDTINHTNAPGPQFFSYVWKALKHSKTISGIVAQRLKGSKNQGTWVTLRSQLETVPNPQSRVTLTDKKDRLGMPRLAFDWQLTRQDLESYHHFRGLLFDGLRQAGLQFRVLNHETDETGWPVTMMSGKHHMGTTRMHSDPSQGVLDANCKVHGVENLFVAGSSMFPTSGQANPMLTVVALAIRLADYVKRVLKDSPNLA